MKLKTVPLDLSLLPETRGVYLVGGTTRDLLLGRTPADYDITVAQNPEIFAEKIATRSNGRMIPMGSPEKRSYRVVSGKIVFDVTEISGPTIRHDLERRDVTINAMAVDVSSGALLDWVHGRRDLIGRQIRMVSEKNFRDDPVRLLRVFRLASALGFSIEAGTLAAVSQNARRIHFSAGERIRAELHQFFATPHSAPHLAAMARTGLLAAILASPERDQKANSGVCPDLSIGPLSAYNRLEEIMNAPPPWFPEDGLPDAPDRAAWQKFAMLLPPCRELSSSEDDAADRAETICRRLRLSARESAFITGMVRHHPRTARLHKDHMQTPLSLSAITRFFMSVESLAPHLVLHALAKAEADAADGQKNPESFSEFARHLLHLYTGTYLPRKALPPLVTGRDLQTLFGLPPSPLFKRILSRLEEGRLSGEIADRESALRCVAGMMEDDGDNRQRLKCANRKLDLT